MPTPSISETAKKRLKALREKSPEVFAAAPAISRISSPDAMRSQSAENLRSRIAAEHLPEGDLQRGAVIKKKKKKNGGTY